MIVTSLNSFCFLSPPLFQRSLVSDCRFKQSYQSNVTNPCPQTIDLGPGTCTLHPVPCNGFLVQRDTFVCTLILWNFNEFLKRFYQPTNEAQYSTVLSTRFSFITQLKASILGVRTEFLKSQWISNTLYSFFLKSQWFANTLYSCFLLTFSKCYELLNTLYTVSFMNC